MIEIMETHDENNDGKFEMSELANLMKLEKNFLDKMIGQQSISDKQVKVRRSEHCKNLSDEVKTAAGPKNRISSRSADFFYCQQNPSPRQFYLTTTRTRTVRLKDQSCTLLLETLRDIWD